MAQPTPLHIVFGHPEFWKAVEEKYALLFAALFRVQNVLNELTSAGYSDVAPVQRVLLNLGMLSMVSMVEAVTLVGNGMSQGALKLVRCMLEYGINAEYLRRNPHLLEDYMKFVWVEQWRFQHYLKDKAPERYIELDTTDVDREYNACKARFEDRSGRVRNSWCSVNMRDRADMTDFQQEYRLIYQEGSKLVHGSFGAVLMYFTPDDVHRLAVPPRIEWSDQALTGGHACVLRMVDTLCRAFNVQSKPSYQELLDEFHTVWGKLSAE